MPGFRASNNVRVFSECSDDGLERFAPESIAAPKAILIDLARRRLRDELRCTVEHSLVVLTSDWSGLLGEEGRELLWRVFGVPCFEMLLAPDGTIAAVECEAHEGYHLLPGSDLGSWRGPMIPGVCHCGAGTSRIALLAPHLELEESA